MKKIIGSICFVLQRIIGFAQSDTLFWSDDTFLTSNTVVKPTLQPTVNTTEDTTTMVKLVSPSDSSNQIPQKMFLTQRLLWGKKGLMRNFDKFDLSPSDREREISIRDKMISAHQFLGYATLAGLASFGVTGIMINKDKEIRDLHQELAGVTNLLYFSTATMVLFATPRLKDRNSGWSNVKINKTLSILHFIGMITTNVLAERSTHDPDLVKYHKIAAISTFATYLASTIVIRHYISYKIIDTLF